LLSHSLKNRSKSDIVGPILEAANGRGATKTKIMYKAFLSYGQLKEYLTILLEKGLIKYEEGREIYRTTEKGMRFLQMYTKVQEMMPLENVNKK
jgi:predicted transcriptional regulator